MPDKLTKVLIRQAKRIYTWGNDLTRGVLSIVWDAIQRFSEVRGAEAAASISFYAIFSLFPLLLAMIVTGSFILESKQVQGWVLGIVNDFFPVAQRLIERNIQRVLELRGTVGVVALVGLVWSATGVLMALARNINLAWPEAKSRNFVEDRAVALGMVTGLALLLILSSVANTVLNVLARLSIPILGDIAVQETSLWRILLSIGPRLTLFLALWGLYRWIPNTAVRWRDAFWGAVIAASAGEIANYGFTWYLSSGIARYELVYGSLGTVVALMLWIYIGALIVLFGVHISAAVTRHAKKQDA